MSMNNKRLQSSQHRVLISHGTGTATGCTKSSVDADAVAERRVEEILWKKESSNWRRADII